MAKIKLKSHNDLDGVTPGILAKIAYGDNVEVQYCTNSFIDKAVSRFLEKSENNHVDLIITDISVNEENELKLEERYKQGKSICLIDHHKTAKHLNDYDWAKVQSEYANGKKTAATSLFYEYLVEKGDLKRTNALDEFVELVRQYDTWEWDENQNLTAKRLNDLFYIIGREVFEEKMLERLMTHSNGFKFDKSEEMLLKMEEEKIERYIKQKSKQLIEVFVRDKKVGIVHVDQYHSEVGNQLGKSFEYLDLVIMVSLGSKKVSYRTIHDDIDVSEFASYYGGGGHPKASGSSLTKDAFDDFVKDVFYVLPRKPDVEKNKYNTKESIYGTVYENYENELSWIHPIGEKWLVMFDGVYEDRSFDTFKDAEWHLKRYSNSWLCRDDILVDIIVSKYDIKEQTLRSQFEKTMNKFFVEDFFNTVF